MALHDALLPAMAAPARTRLRGDAVAVLLATLVFAGLHALRGFPDLLTAGGDNDSLLRLVEVRDWLGGQGWFDLHQYRMGPPGGFVMHWSRLVDAPLGALVLLGRALSGSQTAGEVFAQVAWPLLCFAGSLLALLKICRRVAGEGAALPALVLGTAALHFVGTFAPGNIDHHGLQLFLSLSAVAFLLRAEEAEAGQRWPAAAAGTCAALMLGIGAETAPYVAVAGLYVALRFALAGEAARAQARGFGLGFGGAAAAVFSATVAPASWFQPACDAFSAPQALLGLVGGLGLAGIAAVRPISRTCPARLLALGLLGSACAGLAFALFPQCLGDPYAGVDPRLKEFWLDNVMEAQPLHRLAADWPVLAAGYFATPFLAAVLLTFGLARRRARAALLLPGLMLGAAVAVSFWQVRGAFFSVPFAVPALAAFVAERRREAQAPGAGHGAVAAMALSWLISIPVIWSALVALLVPMSESEAAEPIGPAGAQARCEAPAAFAALAALPPANVAAISNLGSLILAHTHHRVLAGPYHRNTAGNLANLEIWLAEPAQARARLVAAETGLVAFCAGNPETRSLARAAPRSLVAELAARRPPAWLQPVSADAGSPLALYRLAP